MTTATRTNPLSYLTDQLKELDAACAGTGH